MKRLVLCLIPLALGAAPVEGVPNWAVQVGGSRTSGDWYGHDPLVPTLGVQWCLPVTARQGFRGWVDYAQLKGTRAEVLVVAQPETPAAPFAWVAGTGRQEQKALSLGVDYQIRFLRGPSSPYCFVGPHVSRMETTHTFQGGGHQTLTTDQGTHAGVALGLGMQFQRKVDLEFRLRHFGAYYTGQDFYSFLVGYHF